jgi:hypothetical protein
MRLLVFEDANFTSDIRNRAGGDDPIKRRITTTSDAIMLTVVILKCDNGDAGATTERHELGDLLIFSQSILCHEGA